MSDERKTDRVAFRVSWFEKLILEEITEALGVSMSDAVRLLIYVARVLYDPGLKLRKALRVRVTCENLEETLEKPLADLIRPIDELRREIKLDGKLARFRETKRTRFKLNR